MLHNIEEEICRVNIHVNLEYTYTQFNNTNSTGIDELIEI